MPTSPHPIRSVSGVPAGARDLTAYSARLTAELHDNILPFWLRHAVDELNGGFYGEVGEDLVPDPVAERGALLTTRILWTFSSAYLQKPEPAYRRMADLAYADLNARFRDLEHGGYYWSAGGDGRVLRDRKQVYGQAFAVYALSEYYAATCHLPALDEALATVQLIEQHARDRELGGYLEAFGRRWEPIADMRLSDSDLNAPKSQNTMLHVMEAYTNLLRVHRSPEITAALHALVETMLDRVLDPVTGHLGLFFERDWTPLSNRASYGHDIEAAWLLAAAAEVVGDAGLSRRVAAAEVGLAELTLREGVDTDGAIYNEGGPAGADNFGKEWWPQAEAVVGFLDAALVDDRPEFVSAALRAWDFIEARLIDRKDGEWFRGTERNGRIVGGRPKISFWKCPYHNSRACLVAPRRLSELAARRT